MAGTGGFSHGQSVVIVLAWVLSLIWMIWLVMAGFVGQSGLTRSMA